MDNTLDDIGPVLIALPIFGLMIMTVMPPHWQNGRGWLLVSYVGIPAFIVIIAILVNVPMLLFFAILLIGLNAT